MKFFPAIFLFCIGTAWAIQPTIEGTKELGNGFRFLTIAKDSNSTFESIGHFQYLYYKETQISQSDTCSVAKDGKFAIYQDGPSGNIFVFFPSQKKSIQLTKKFPGLVSEFIIKSENTVAARLYDHPTLTLTIPQQTEQGAAGNSGGFLKAY